MIESHQVTSTTVIGEAVANHMRVMLEIGPKGKKAELRHLTAAYDAGRLGANERRTFLTTKIARIARQIASLEEMRSTFERELSRHS